MREYIFKAQYRGVGFTTIEVSDELRRGVKAGYEHLAPARQQIETVNPEGWLRILTPSSADEHRLRKALDRSLDPGEAWCLALAASRGLILATDDLAVRRLADSEGISLTGNLGILVALSHAILVMSLLALPLPICFFSSSLHTISPTYLCFGLALLRT